MDLALCLELTSQLIYARRCQKLLRLPTLIELILTDLVNFSSKSMFSTTSKSTQDIFIP